MYLFIFEDGTIEKSMTCSDDYVKFCDAGKLHIINITDVNNPLEYYNSNWFPIANV